MGNSLFGVGASALSAAQSGLLTAGHNIANANTPNYNRQRIEQAAIVPQDSTAGYIGKGVRVESVRRQYDALLAGEARTAQSLASHSQAYSDQLQRIDLLLADPSTGVSPAVDDFFSAVHDVATNPADLSTRQNLLSAAQALAGRFHEMDTQFAQLRTGTNQRIVASVGEINTLGTQIAQLNRQIADASAVGASPPNDLLDRRDTLAASLAKQAATRIVVSDAGDYNVFLGNGQSLVLGTQSFALLARADPLDAENMQVGLQAGATLSVYRSSDLAGGVLGGLLAFRDETLAVAQNSVGRIALALGAAFNSQQSLGLDRNGVAGGNLFAIGAPTVLTTSAATLSASISDYSALTTSDYRLRYDGTNYTLTRLSDSTQTVFATFPQTVDGLTLALNPPLPAPAANDSFLIQPTRTGASALGVLISSPGLIAAAAPVRSAASLANTGSGSISAPSVSTAYTATPLAAALTLTYSAGAGTFSGFPGGSAVTVTASGVATVYAAGTPVLYSSGATIEWDGIRMQISGAPANGDTFRVEPNANGSGDNRNALSLAALQINALLGNSTLQQSYGQLTSLVGNKSREMQLAAQAQGALVSQIAQTRESISGVNLDEEAADLLRYQQAYQAAGKLMGIASSLFDAILNIGR